MTRALFVSVAILCVLTFATPAVAEEPQFPNAVLDRIGRLPGELVAAKKTDGEIVDALFIATLLRLPKDAEKETAAKHLADTRDRQVAALDLAWALVNSKEFLKLHGLDKNPAESLKMLNKLTAEWGKADKKQKEK